MQRLAFSLYLSLALTACAVTLSACAAATDETRSGMELYMNYCSACHGREGEGDGPVGAVMQIPVPNLRALQMRNDGMFPADAVRAYVDGREIPASHGDRRMPIWGNVFQWNEDEDSEQVARRRIDAVITFVEQLQYR
jgi:mono/diheme cytochrome c family protein